MPMSKALAAVLLTSLLCVAMATYGLLTIYKANTDLFLTLLSTMVGPMIGILYTTLKTEKIEQRTKEIERNTNGPLTTMREEVHEIYEIEKEKQS